MNIQSFSLSLLSSSSIGSHTDKHSSFLDAEFHFRLRHLFTNILTVPSQGPRPVHSIRRPTFSLFLQSSSPNQLAESAEEHPDRLYSRVLRTNPLNPLRNTPTVFCSRGLRTSSLISLRNTPTVFYSRGLRTSSLNSLRNTPTDLYSRVLRTSSLNPLRNTPTVFYSRGLQIS